MSTWVGSVGGADTGVDTSGNALSAGSITGAYTAAVPVGDTILLAILGGGGKTVTGITDSKGNTYAVDLSQTDGTVETTAIARCVVSTPISGGDTFTVTFSAVSVFHMATADHYAGSASPDQQATCTPASSATPTTAASPATTHSTEVVFAALGIAGGLTRPVAGAGVNTALRNSRSAVNTATNSARDLYAIDRDLTTAGAQTMTANLSAMQPWCIVEQTYFFTTGGGGGGGLAQTLTAGLATPSGGVGASAAYPGFALRVSGPDITSAAGTYPWAKTVNLLQNWSVIEASDNVFDFSSLDVSFQYAITNGIQCGIRIEAALDGLPGWAYSANSLGPGVASLTTYTDPSDPTGARTPVPWDPTLRLLWARLCRKIQAYLQTTFSGKRYADVCAFVAVSGPTALVGTEMTIGDSADSRNTANWDAVLSPVSARRAAYQQAWINCTLDALTNIGGVPISIASGTVWGDGRQAYMNLVDYLKANLSSSQYARMMGGPTDLRTDQPGAASYAAWSAAADAALKHTIAQGMRTWGQTAGWSWWSQSFTGGTLKAIETAYLTDGVGQYQMSMVESNTQILGNVLGLPAWCQNVLQPAILAQRTIGGGASGGVAYGATPVIASGAGLIQAGFVRGQAQALGANLSSGALRLLAGTAAARGDAPAVIVEDSFDDRTVSPGLGNPQIGEWDPTSGTANVQVTGGAAIYTGPVSGGRRFLAGPALTADSYHKSTVQFPDGTSGNNLVLYHLHRFAPPAYPSANLRPGIGVRNSDQALVLFGDSTKGNGAFLGNPQVVLATSGNWSASDVWTLETMVVGDTMYRRAWRAASDPIPGWTMDTLTDAGQLASGQNGIWFFNNNGVTGTPHIQLYDTGITVARVAPVIPGPRVSLGEGDGIFVEIGWTDAAGIFTIGTSKLGGSDVLAGNFPLEDYTDITSEVQSVQISRGRQDATSAMQQSTCAVTVVDATGKYNAANPASPLYGQIAPSRPMRVYVKYGNTNYNLWTGVTSEVVAAASKHDPFASISGVDLLERLSQEEPAGAPPVDTTTGAAIGIVLDAVGWWGDRRRIPTGDQLKAFSTDSAQVNDQFVTLNGVPLEIPGTTKALDVINQILDHEGGIFFMDADGNAVYQPYQGTNMVSAVVSATNLITPGVSISTIFNRCAVTASQGNEQEYLDGASANRHGPRDIPSSPLTAQWLPDEESAAILAERLVRINQTEPIWGLTLQKADLSISANQATYIDMLSIDLGDRITLDDPASGTLGDYSVEGVTHTIQGGGLDHETTWVLRMRPVHVFTIGQSVLDGPDTLGA